MQVNFIKDEGKEKWRKKNILKTQDYSCESVLCVTKTFHQYIIKTDIHLNHNLFTRSSISYVTKIY